MGGRGPDGCTCGGPVGGGLARRVGPPQVQPFGPRPPMAALVEAPVEVPCVEKLLIINCLVIINTTLDISICSFQI